MSDENIITQELYDLHPEYAEAGLVVGDAIPDAVVIDEEETKQDEPENVSQETAAPKREEVSQETTEVTEKVIYFKGKAIVSDTFRTVEDKKYHHVRLEDGTTEDLTNDEYDSLIKSQ